jgi:hypothetical protein
MPACARQQHCALCGILLLGKKRRLFCPTEGVKFIRRQCKPTPFLHAFLEATLPSQPAKLGLCIPCVNWKRRAERGTLKRTARPMLQLDQMILFLMQPGKHQEPDHRCMERLVEAVRQPCNPYRSPLAFFFGLGLAHIVPSSSQAHLPPARPAHHARRARQHVPALRGRLVGVQRPDRVLRDGTGGPPGAVRAQGRPARPGQFFF